MITKTPFKPNGVFKKGFSFYNGTIHYSGGPGMMDVPAHKNKLFPWTFADCPNMGPKLKAMGFTVKQVAERTGLKEASAKALLAGNYRITPKNADILTQMEKEHETNL